MGKESGSITAGEESALFEEYRASGDVSLRDEIFSTYQWVVESVVRGFHGAGDREELRQVGYIGLINAIERFDVEKGFRFNTYATHCVEGEIRHFLRDKSDTIRRPRWVRKLSSQLAAFLEAFLHQNQRLPTLREISDALDITEEGVKAILRAKQPASLDDERSGQAYLRESVKSTRMRSFRLPIEDRISINEAFDKLLELEQKVIYLFFVQDFTQKEIAGKLALSPRKVSRLMQKALVRLRGQLEGKKSGSEKGK
jgi:RNA polymerase sigma-B factor